MQTVRCALIVLPDGSQRYIILPDRSDVEEGSMAFPFLLFEHPEEVDLDGAWRYFSTEQPGELSDSEVSDETNHD